MRNFWMGAPVVALAITGACASPSAPTATPPPAAPVAKVGDPPLVTCPGALSLTAPFTGPATVNYPEPAVGSGEGLVTVACAPAPDANFPIGATNVE
ncbi:MAG: hypothetical protein ABI039_13555, partial [Vicinamibacterales bacterium]